MSRLFFNHSRDPPAPQDLTFAGSLLDKLKKGARRWEFGVVIDFREYQRVSLVQRQGELVKRSTKPTHYR